MTIPQRLRLVMVLAGVFYLSIIAAGLSGFDMTVWGVSILLFMLWHLLMHEPTQGPAWLTVIGIHAALSALCLWIGHGIGALTGLSVSPVFALAFALGTLATARIVNLSPEQQADLAEQLNRTIDVTEERKVTADWRNDLTEAEEARVREVLDDAAALHASAGAEALKPMVLRLRDAGPADLVLERLERELRERDTLPLTRLHAAFVLSPRSARNFIGGPALTDAIARVLETGHADAIRHVATDAAALVETVPDAAASLPEPDHLLAQASRFETVDHAAAAELRRLARSVAEARDG